MRRGGGASNWVGQEEHATDEDEPKTAFSSDPWPLGEDGEPSRRDR